MICDSLIILTVLWNTYYVLCNNFYIYITQIYTYIYMYVYYMQNTFRCEIMNTMSSPSYQEYDDAI